MKKHSGAGRGAPAGPSQRQLRAGELIRHALVEILREEDFADPDLAGVSVTLTEVRMSPDLRHAHCFVEPLGGQAAGPVVAGLNRHAKFLRGRLTSSSPTTRASPRRPAWKPSSATRKWPGTWGRATPKVRTKPDGAAKDG